MTLTHGNKQTYLRMDLEIKDKKVVMLMDEYLIEFLTDFPEDINVAAKTPSTKCLTKTTINAQKLDESKGKIFHGIVKYFMACTKIILCVNEITFKHPSDRWILIYKSTRPNYGGLGETEKIILEHLWNFKIAKNDVSEKL